jgi:hypothetical protein
MLQLFLKTSDISAEDWTIIYQKIGDLVTAFPLKLIRIESYNGYESNQDKDHLNLLVNSGMEDEYFAFSGDFISWTSGTTIRFYKNWEKRRQLALQPAHSDSSKLITWYPTAPPIFQYPPSVYHPTPERNRCQWADYILPNLRYSLSYLGEQCCYLDYYAVQNGHFLHLCL